MSDTDLQVRDSVSNPCQDMQTGQDAFPEIAAALTANSGTYTRTAAVAAMSHVDNSFATYEAPRSYQHSKFYKDAKRWEAAVQLELNSFVDKEVLRPCN